MITHHRLGAAGAVVANGRTGGAVIANDRARVAGPMVPDHGTRFARPVVADYRFGGLAMVSHDGLARGAVVADNRRRRAVVADYGTDGTPQRSGSAGPTARANDHSA